jgi:hypothetical protein
LPDLASCDILFPQLKIPPFWHNWGDHGRLAGMLNPHRTRFPGCI